MTESDLKACAQRRNLTINGYWCSNAVIGMGAHWKDLRAFVAEIDAAGLRGVRARVARVTNPGYADYDKAYAEVSSQSRIVCRGCRTGASAHHEKARFPCQGS